MVSSGTVTLGQVFPGCDDALCVAGDQGETGAWFKDRGDLDPGSTAQHHPAVVQVLDTQVVVEVGPV